ncbi:hypothetical protein E2C01_014984 [Portunus trituberculatus]|uniref:Uncharacterized protein n=1 Tax=Portunus trituberculatus TaxID=210409 RepID=A0A5B7DKH1_PORTR|nr:hypothetical protein [Portunus trituberculatus]
MKKSLWVMKNREERGRKQNIAQQILREKCGAEEKEGDMGLQCTVMGPDGGCWVCPGECTYSVMTSGMEMCSLARTSMIYLNALLSGTGCLCMLVTGQTLVLQVTP